MTSTRLDTSYVSVTQESWWEWAWFIYAVLLMWIRVQSQFLGSPGHSERKPTLKQYFSNCALYKIIDSVIHNVQKSGVLS